MYFFKNIQIVTFLAEEWMPIAIHICYSDYFQVPYNREKNAASSNEIRNSSSWPDAFVDPQKADMSPSHYIIPMRAHRIIWPNILDSSCSTCNSCHSTHIHTRSPTHTCELWIDVRCNRRLRRRQRCVFSRGSESKPPSCKSSLPL